MKNNLLNILELIKLGEKIKSEMRHSWLSNGRQESVAEHTWRVSLMEMLIEPYLTQKVNSAKLLKMIIIHDLVEAEAGDIPAFDTMNDRIAKEQKAINERKSIERIRDMLGNALGNELYTLWYEFEEKATYEAKVANALDKLEAQIQHNEADLSTWLDIEHKMSFMMDKHVGFDQTLQLFKDIIEDEAEVKLKEAGIDTEKMKGTASPLFT
ncbi:HD domain-containing protein [Rossellomorea aquimaris]|jgi:putative hydrolases of HD superfamily|uniref:HD domain-containing protein n=1 Tax=Rossellomorea aquimaris TaxID=189382 RepID=A0A5D4U428_9BACI|nr:HD domain-containing protein [Rossellomorea aquimaris]TYS81900.1 HD domain-containing protein [Rossellomorea aquimaris]TYS88524.1 HD domain-containing protein [Rossellomorea aquimaris]